MRNEIIFDSRGIPDILVVFTPNELGLPAKLRGKAVKEYAISKYPNTIIGDRPYSLPYQQPAVNVSHDEAIRLCESKGSGWHLITNDEWSALGLQSRKLGTLPRGNTNNGKSHSHPEETGITYEGGYGKTLTGSGPVTWNHDHTAEGIADMCGNIWEHVGGIRFMDGKVEIIPDNGAAAGADQSKDSKEWESIYTPDGDPIYFNPKENGIVLESTGTNDKNWDVVMFSELKRNGLDIPEKLIKLGLYPEPGYESKEAFWIDNNDERCVYRGGHWNDGTYAGVFYLSGANSRSDVDTNIGFRSALVRYSGDSGNLKNLDNQTEDMSSAAEELTGMLKLMLTKVLTEIYTVAGGDDVLTLRNMVYNASDAQIEEAIRIASQLAQLNISAYAMRKAVDQAKHVLTTSIAIKGAADNE